MSAMVERVLENLEGVKRNGAGWMARCPAHQDKTASLSIGEGDDGRILLKCMAGCETERVVELLGYTMADLMPEKANGNGRGKLGEIVATYPYTDEDLNLLYEVCRFSPKDFRQRRPDGKGGWTWSTSGVQRVLFHLPRVAAEVKAGKQVIVVEGERDVESLAKLGVVATCNASGAGKWCDAYSKQLVGAKLVAILPDNDKAGQDHARAVAASLKHAGVEHVVVELPGLPEKGDVSDWLAAGGTKGQLEELIVAATNAPQVADAAAVSPTGDIPTDEDDPIGGRLDWAAFWAEDDEEDEWLYPDVLAKGRGHVIYAEHKLGKSLLMLYVAAELATGDEPAQCVYLDFEMSPADVRERLADMGYGAATDLSRFHYHLWPSLPPLDTDEGAQALVAGIDAYQAARPDCHIALFIDTFGRAVDGPDDATDTARAFFNRTGIELKRRGITWVRLDHAGKDPTRGMRGASAKGDDVDVVWELVKSNDGVALRRDAARMAWVPQRVSLTMSEWPLAYQHTAFDWPERTGEIANMLERFGVPLGAGERAARGALKAHEEKCSNETLRAALRFRRETVE